MQRLLTGLAAMACVVLLPAASFAQSAFGNGIIAGVAKDTSGAVLPGVTVEAASPALIERVRSTVTDSGGQYTITGLRPGTYTVSFTLTGFAKYQRDRLELAGSATITVNAELKVGSIEETITVTGETPVVDLQSTTRERVMSKDVIDALPTSRLSYSLGVLVPGVSASTRDVGGAGGSQFNTTLTAHGSQGADQRVTVSGLNQGAIHVGNISNVIPNTGASQEVVIETAAASAERSTGGVSVNFIPRDGGNTLRGSIFLTGAAENQQASNFTQELIDQGATASPNKFRRTTDFNPGFGGPILRDRLWFYYAYRNQTSQNKTDMFYNQNEFLPNVWTYVPNPGRPALSRNGIWHDNNLRVTWQVDPKNKMAFSVGDQTKCECPDNISGTRAPEAADEEHNPLQRTWQAEWSSPMTNRMLVEVVAQGRQIRQGQFHLAPTSAGGSVTNMSEEQWNQIYPALIGVTLTNGGGIVPNGLQFHGPAGTFNTAARPSYAYRASVSYVTGAHAFKVGVQDAFGYANNQTYIPTRDTLNRAVRYRFNTANTPDQVTVFNTPTFIRNDLDHDLGLYAQDRWTRDRLTLNLGVRYDWVNASYPAQTLPASLNGRPETMFEAGESLNWKDVTPRIGASYDLRGDGKTAIKVSLNKYVANQALGGIAGSANPLAAGRGIVNTWNRNWTDTDGDFVVDCNVFNSAKNGECTNTIAPNVLNVTPSALQDLDLRSGWGKRGYNWEFSAGVQRELMPRVSVDVSYFRRWYGNFTVNQDIACVDTVNQLGCRVPGNYKSYDVTVPVDSRLPGGGGYLLSGFIDPDCTGPQASCGTATAAQIAALTTVNKAVLTDDLGAKRADRWNGVDVIVNARLQNGLFLQGGTSTGRRTTDECEVWALVPAAQGTGTARSSCQMTEPWITQVKGAAGYTLRRYDALPPTVARVLEDVQVAGTFQSIPGGAMTATYAMTNAEFATACPSVTADTSCSTLARFLSNQTQATNTRNINLIAPGTVYDERQNQLDLRVGRILRFGRTRTSINLDIFNAFNQNTILGRNNALAKSTIPGSYAAAAGPQADGKFHTLWVPTEVLQARFYKISVNFDF